MSTAKESAGQYEDPLAMAVGWDARHVEIEESDRGIELFDGNPRDIGDVLDGDFETDEETEIEYDGNNTIEVESARYVEDSREYRVDMVAYLPRDWGIGDHRLDPLHRN